MARFSTLCSGSGGNSSYIGSADRGILIDAGLNAKQLGLAMTRLSLDPSRLMAVFITHEHNDHVSAVRVFASKYHLPVYATDGTLQAMKRMSCLSDKYPVFPLSYGDTVELDQFRVRCFKTSHDSAQSCGYAVELGDDRKISVLTDTGYVTPEAMRAVRGSDLVLLESNHDVRMLKTGPYPYYLKQRILSDRGHLSNDACAKAACELVNSGTTRLILGHLSRHNNHPDLALATTLRALGEMGAVENIDFALSVAPPGCGERTLIF